MIMTALRGATHLECTATGDRYESEQLIRLSDAGKPLFARYALDEIAPGFQVTDLAGRRPDLWRYEEVLPVRDRSCQVQLGEGWTPLLDAPRLASHMGVRRVWVKNEGVNPTGSFKDRGLCLAVSRAKELGAKELAIPSAGNAGSASAAYAAAAGLPVHVVVPTDTPAPIVEEIRALGADLQLLDGLISDCGAVVRQGCEEHGWFDLSTLKEPYRVEGKKTMGYEIFEQLGLRLPDAIVYPTGGGTGPDRDVEGLRRDGAHGLDRLRTTEDVLGPGSRVRSDCAERGRTAWRMRGLGRTRPPTRPVYGCQAPSGTSSSCARSANRAVGPLRSRTTRWPSGCRSWEPLPECSRPPKAAPSRQPCRG